MLELDNEGKRAPKRTVVLGCRGFVGAAICRRLQADGLETLGISSREIDLCEPGAGATLAERLDGDDALVVVSALTPDRGKDIATMMQNLAMIQHVVDALARRPVAQVVYIGSDAVYRDDANPVRETSCCDPGAYHGMMHLARELMLKTSSSSRLTILRPSLLYGADDPHNGYGPNRFRRTAAAGRMIQLFGAGEEKRDHVFVDDLAEIASRCVTHRTHGTLNVATGQSASFMECAQLVAAQHAEPVEIVTTERHNPITHRHFDITATLKAFPMMRFTPLADGIAATCAASQPDK